MDDNFGNIPEDVRDEMAKAGIVLSKDSQPAPPPEQLQAIADAIASKRDDAVQARASSGIENVWRDDEEAYVGVDDANRGEYGDAKWTKAMSTDGPVTTSGQSPTPVSTRSTVFVRLTARYVDAGTAKIAEILLPPNDKAFSFTETPVPDVIRAKDDNRQMVDETTGQPLTKDAPQPAGQPAQPTAAPSGAAAPSSASGTPAAGQQPLMPGAPQAVPTAPPQTPLTVADLANEKAEMIRKKAKRAETRIYDWMVECNARGEKRKMIFDSARLGVGVMKGPFPTVSRAMAITDDGHGGVDVQIKESIKPASKWVDPWNFFPDPTCGENPRDGNYCFERDYLADKGVRELKSLPGYFKDAIDKILFEGPDGDQAEQEDQKTNKLAEQSQKNGRFTVWYFHGTLKRTEVECWNAAVWDKPEHGLNPRTENATAEEQQAEDGDIIFVIGTMINSKLIHLTVNPLGTGHFPYNTVPWQRRPGSWAGIGVAEQLKTPQRMLNSATRAMLNNAGKSAGTQIVLDRGLIQPGDDIWEITPDKIWETVEDQEVADVTKAFHMFQIPNQTDPLMKIINYSLQLAEESTSIPLVTQGQSGVTTPNTATGEQLQDTNANQLLRSIGATFDDNLTEPETRDYYEWLLLDPDVPDDEKGDFKIDAHGSSSLVERAIHDQTIATMAPIVINPAYGLNPRRWAKALLKSKRLDGDEIANTPEEQQKIDSVPPLPAPAVQVAQIRSKDAATAVQADANNAAADRQIEVRKIAATEDRDNVFARNELQQMQTTYQLAMLDYANKRNISLDQVKAELAQTSMKLATQKDLALADHTANLHMHHNPQVATPAIEPPGRAPNGEAFEK